MSRLDKKHKRPADNPARGSAPDTASGRFLSLAGRLRARWRAWRESKNPVLIFIAVFAVLMALYYVATLSSFFHHMLFPSCLRFNAGICHGILCLLGQDAIVSGTSISASGFTIDIRRGCDAIEATALFMAAVLAFPGPWRKKLPGILAGALLLQGLNQVRILSLFYIGLHWPGGFHAMHAEVWQVIFILVAMVQWVVWIQWALRQPRAPAVAHAVA